MHTDISPQPAERFYIQPCFIYIIYNFFKNMSIQMAKKKSRLFKNDKGLGQNRFTIQQYNIPSF